MRVIAGRLKGREIKSPTSHKTHPMSDKVRGALFNVLGDIEDLTFLDVFAGSGALSIEALSRGAKSAVAIDVDRVAYSAIGHNIEELGLNDQLRAVRARASGWSARNTEQKFDVLLFDPPYDDLQINLVERLIKLHLKPGALAVLSFPGNFKPEKLVNTEIVSDKNYGDAQLVFYRKTK
jgi:16S rRNA (guanine966-N2)-methyltransferase